MSHVLKTVKLTILGLALGSTSLLAKEEGANIQKLNWDGLEVVWLKDERYPVYNMAVYFADGALGDATARRGETSAALNLLTSGTRRFDQKEINENLEFFGVDYGAHVTHEFATYSMSGLVKDLIPTVKLMCHLMSDTVYPEKVLKREKTRSIEGLENLVSSHGQLASRAFRELSLKETPFDYPSSGKIEDMKRIGSTHLKSKLQYLNNEVKKRIYLTGPASVLDIKRVVQEECGWKDQQKLYQRKVHYEHEKPKRETPEIYLVPVKKANQAQVRMGRFIPRGQISSHELMGLASDYLGGGFTAPLMRELRVMRGLTYSVSAFAGPQRYYGRSGIATFTKNETLGKLLKVTKDVLEKNQRGEFSEDQFTRAVEGLAGRYPFRFEEPMSYMTQLMYLDHEGRDLSELYKFQENVRELTREELTRELKNLYGWSKMTIVVVGDRSLEEQLLKFGPVKIVKPGQVL